MAKGFASSLLIGFALTSSLQASEMMVVSESHETFEEKATSTKTPNPLHDKKGRIEGRLYGGIGPQASIVTPEALTKNLVINMDRKDGVDENGHPMTVKKRRGRAFAHKFADTYVKRYKELLTEGKIDPIAKQETQLEYWKRKNEETKLRIKKEGPITSKHFTRPGLNHQESDRYYLPSTRVRWKNGKFEPIFDENDPAAKKITHSAAYLEKQHKLKEIKKEIEARGERRTPIEKTRVIRRITGIDAAQDAFISGNAGKHIKIEDIQKFSKERQTLEKPEDSLSDEERLKKEFPDAFRPQSSLWDEWFSFLLGIQKAKAADFTIDENVHSKRFMNGTGQKENIHNQSQFEEFAEEAHKQNEEVSQRFLPQKKEKNAGCETCAENPIEVVDRYLQSRKEKEQLRKLSSAG